MKSWHVLRLTAHEFLALPEYSCSLPTGTTIGKRWRRLDGSYDHAWKAAGGKPFWVVGEYMNHPNPERVTIRWYKPHICVRAGAREQ